VSAGFRIAFLSEVEHSAEARQWERVIKERLPKSEVFNWRECSLNSHRAIERDARILANWADLILGFGSRSACDRMAGWPEMVRWRKESKAILWLHAAPVDDPTEEVQSPDVEVMRREVWSQIDPLIGWILNFAEQNVNRWRERAQQEEFKADQDELQRLTRQWEYLDEERYPRNPFRKRRDVLYDPSFEVKFPPTKENYERWEAERKKKEAPRWHNIELSSRSETTVGAVAQADNAADIYLVRVTGSQRTHATRGADEVERIPDPDAPVTDSVSCAIYSPPQWEGGTTELVQICLYLRKDLNTVETESLAVDPMARRLRAQVLGVDLSRNTRLSITLSLDPPCDISPTLASVIWRGEAISVSFAVKILPVLRRVRALGTVEIRLERSAAPIGVLHFRVELVPQGSRTESVARPLGEVARLTEFVFVSYASEDRSEVLRRVQGLKALGIQFFQDILSLSPGQRWAQELWRCIDQSDVFLLCWSSSASKSEWVRKEYLQANTTSRSSPDNRPHIAILPLEGPPPPEPPPELAHLHFSDDLLYALKVESDISAAARKHSND
jgi:TIR domain-containing protein